MKRVVNEYQMIGEKIKIKKKERKKPISNSILTEILKVSSFVLSIENREKYIFSPIENLR